MLRRTTSSLCLNQHVRVKAVVDHDVVFHHAVEALAVLEAAVQAEVVVDVRNSMEPSSRSMSQPWSQRQRLLRRMVVLTASSSTHVLVGFPGLVVVQVQAVQAPEAVAAPGVERAVVAGFLDRVEDVAELDHVAAPAAVADVDAGARHVVEGAVADGDALRQLDLHRRGLLLDAAREVDQAVVHEAVGRVVVGLRAGRAVERCERLGMVVPVARHSRGVAVADERHAVGRRPWRCGSRAR